MFEHCTDETIYLDEAMPRPDAEVNLMNRLKTAAIVAASLVMTVAAFISEGPELLRILREGRDNGGMPK